MTEHGGIVDGGPHTRAGIARDLRQLGVTEGSTLIVHSSLSRLGWVASGAHAVVLALLDAVGPSGTLVMPTHSGGHSDPGEWRNPPVPEAWWPTISEEATGLGEGSPLARPHEADGWVLPLGVGHGNNTSLHLGEYRADFPDKRRVVQRAGAGGRRAPAGLVGGALRGTTRTSKGSGPTSLSVGTNWSGRWVREPHSSCPNGVWSTLRPGGSGSNGSDRGTRCRDRGVCL